MFVDPGALHVARVTVSQQPGEIDPHDLHRSPRTIAALEAVTADLPPERIYGAFSDVLGVPAMMVLIAAVVLLTLPLAWLLRTALPERAAA